MRTIGILIDWPVTWYAAAALAVLAWARGSHVDPHDQPFPATHLEDGELEGFGRNARPWYRRGAQAR